MTYLPAKILSKLFLLKKLLSFVYQQYFYGLELNYQEYQTNGIVRYDNYKGKAFISHEVFC